MCQPLRRWVIITVAFLFALGNPGKWSWNIGILLMTVFIVATVMLKGFALIN